MTLKKITSAPKTPFAVRLIFATLVAVTVMSITNADASFVQDKSSLKVPAGFAITTYAAGLPDARSMALTPEGSVIVSTRNEGRLYALIDAKNTGRPEHLILTDKFDTPNGIDVFGGDLYIAEKSRLLKVSKIDDLLKNWKDGSQLKYEVLRADLPRDDHHGWRYLRAHDGWLYVSVGAPCNVCLKDQNIYATILRYSLDGKKREVVARGVRNSVGFDFAPADASAGAENSLWFTDNGRDMMGDDLPNDELNHVTKMGQHFGFPFCHQGDTPDPEFAGKAPLVNGKKVSKAEVCEQFTKPEKLLGAHVASLGMRFYEGKQFPGEYRHRIFIAEHGSWNRTSPVGYRVMTVELKDGHAVKYEPFATGWLDESKKSSSSGAVSGRPVDVLVLNDGSLLISDDKSGTIYRVAYEHATESAAAGTKAEH